MNQAICDLYKDMISVYEVFSKDDILAQRDRLQEIYSSLFKQTIECAMFIEGYANKSEIGMTLSHTRPMISNGSFRASLQDRCIGPSRTVSPGIHRPEEPAEHGIRKGVGHCYSRRPGVCDWCPGTCGSSECVGLVHSVVSTNR